MALSDRVRAFFSEVAAVWDAVPGPVKVFGYNVASQLAGFWVAGEFNSKLFVTILLVNLGLYQAPKTVNRIVQGK